MKNIKENLLIVSSGYPNSNGSYLSHTFVKGFADEAKNYFTRVKVLVLRPYFPFYKVKKAKNELKNYTYENIEVIYCNYLYFPIWPFIKYRGLVAYIFNSKNVKKLIDKSYCIHANFTSPAGVFASYLCKSLKMNYILTVHEDHNWLMDEIKSNNRLLISAWENAKTIIRVNNFDSKELRAYNNNVITIPNGYNHRKFKRLDKRDCRLKLGYSLNDKIIINIGFYNDQKNQKLLIDSINLLTDDVKKNLTCIILGGGPKENILKKQISRLGLKDTVFLLGQKNHDDLPLFLNSADIFCLSSNSEGNPTVMFEALGVGLPYIGTNVGGVSEIITNEEYGLLCKPKNELELSIIINKALTLSWDKNKIIEYSKQYSWENIFLMTKNFY